MEFTGDYIVDGVKELAQQFSPDYERAELKVKIEGDKFNDPDILDLAEYLADTADKRAQDVLVRQCILGKTVTFYMDGENLGSVRMNNITDSWAVFPVINDYPATYRLLAESVSVYLLKKSTLPRKKGTGPGAVAATVATPS